MGQKGGHECAIVRLRWLCQFQCRFFGQLLDRSGISGTQDQPGHGNLCNMKLNWLNVTFIKFINFYFYFGNIKGRSFTLADPRQTFVGAPSSGPGTAGPVNFFKNNQPFTFVSISTFEKITASPGSLGYIEICQLMSQNWIRAWENQQKVPYAFKNNQWVGYGKIKLLTC